MATSAIPMQLAAGFKHDQSGNGTDLVPHLF